MKHESLYAKLMLEFVMDAIAEEFMLCDEVSMCALCERGVCDHQVSGLTCRRGIRAKLMRQGAPYEALFYALLGEQFDFLTTLRDSGKTNMYAALVHQKKQYTQWSEEWHGAVLQLWMARMEEQQL